MTTSEPSSSFEGESSLSPPPPPPSGAATAVPRGVDTPTWTCRLCGQLPTTAVTFRQVTGMVLAFRVTNVEGPLCRHHGIAAFRSAQNHTLFAGWWSLLSFVIAPIFVGMNLLERRKVVALDAPPSQLPPAEGRPLYARLGVYVTAVLLVAGSIFIVPEWFKSEAERLDGSCVRVSTTSLTEVACHLRHDAKIVSVVDLTGDDICPPHADVEFVLEDDLGHILCLDFDQ